MTDANKAKGISRRKFLAGVSLTAGGAAVGSLGMLSGCSAPTEGADSQPTTTEVNEKSPLASNPNPQDDSYLSAQKTLTKLFEPAEIGSVKLKNRIIKSGAGSGGLLAKEDTVTPRPEALYYYGSMARGGVGLIIFESSYIEPDCFLGSALNFYDDSFIGVHKAITDEIHQYDCPVFMQLYHFGGLNWNPKTCVSSSTKNYPCSLDMNTKTPTMLTTEGVKEEINVFVEGAVRAQKANFDGVEINAGSSHLLNSFLSRFWNNERDDEYGPQSLENRARIVVEMIEGIKERCGQDFPVSVLFNAVEENFFEIGANQECCGFDETVEFAKLFEAAGADYLHIRTGTFGNHYTGFFPDNMFLGEPGHTGYGTILNYGKGAFPGLIGNSDGTGAFIDIAARIKENVSIPIGTVGCMDPRLAPDMMETALEEGKIDFLIMNRPLIADPDLPNKLKEGKRDEVNPCNHCLTCFDGDMVCRVNPTVARAGTEEMPEGGDLVETEAPKNVVVAGGGPAGMEAARIAALRGHNVSLYEAKSTLGGLLPFAEQIKGTHEKIADYREYLVKQMEITGVDVNLSTELDADLVKSLNPDALVLATGGLYQKAPYSGGESVVNIDEFAGSPEEYENVIILGAQIQGLELAEYLTKKGSRVTLVEPIEELEKMLAGSAMMDEQAGAAMMGGDPAGSDMMGDQADAAMMGDQAGADMMGEQADAAMMAEQAAAFGFMAPPTTIGNHIPSNVKDPILTWLQSKAVKIYESATIVQLSENSVEFKTDYGTTISLEADIVVNALPQAPNAALSEEYKDTAGEVHVVGDAIDPSTIAHAVTEANLLARKL